MPLASRTLILNRRHPAARRLILAAVPNGLNMVDLVQGQSGSRGSGNAGVNSPYLGTAVGKGAAAISWAGRPVTTVRQVTLAFMGTFSSTGSLVSASNFAPSTVILTASSTFTIKINATVIDSGITAATGAHYFVIASYSPDAGICNFAVLRMETGALATSVVSSTFFPAGAPSGAIQSGTILMVLKFMTVAALYMPMPELITWMRDPFGLFRPQMLPLSFMAFSPSAPNIYYPPRRKPALILDQPSLIRRG